jgi:hypothetical protein
LPSSASRSRAAAVNCFVTEASSKTALVSSGVPVSRFEYPHARASIIFPSSITATATPGICCTFISRWISESSRAVWLPDWRAVAGRVSVQARVSVWSRGRTRVM